MSKGIDLEINKEGEYVALMGPSGSWKIDPNESFRLFRHPASGTYILSQQEMTVG
jgi:ABC-type lipoprotein export system ATPase subunit